MVQVGRMDRLIILEVEYSAHIHKGLMYVFTENKAPVTLIRVNIKMSLSLPALAGGLTFFFSLGKSKG